MSSIGELISQFKAAKQAADELEAEIARSNSLADDLVEQTSAIGFDGKAAQIMEAKATAEQAQNTRWLAEGHLEDAIAVLQAVIDGQKGIGTKIPGGAADQAGAATNGARPGKKDREGGDGREGPEGPAADAPPILIAH